MNMNGRRINRLIPVMLSMMFVFGLSIGLTAEIPADVLKAAQEGLQVFKTGQFEMNWLSSEELAAAQLGYGFQVYTINPEILINDQELQLHKMVSPMDLYRFVIMADNKAVSLLTVGKENGVWTTTEFGAAELSREITGMLNAWPTRQGYSHRFIRIYEAKSDLLEISNGAEPMGFTAFESARIGLGLSDSQITPGVLFYNSELMEPLRESVTAFLNREMEAVGEPVNSVR